MEDSQDDCVKEVASDHVIPAKDVDPVMFDDDSESNLSLQWYSIM